jgi:hypothetical protein
MITLCILVVTVAAGLYILKALSETTEYRPTHKIGATYKISTMTYREWLAVERWHALP